ncbi:ICAM5 protein, partial [Syrrhaptes paradoxus]|nr:ICAM5 protein [Syrrhaptes paradoxus]
LTCAASGNPPPRVACAKLGDAAETPPGTPPGTTLGDGPQPPPANVTRAHAGTYLCRATNAHGSALRNVTVAVECEFWGGKRGF